MRGLRGCRRTASSTAFANGRLRSAITKPFGFYMTRVFVGAVTSGLNTMLPYDALYGVPVGLARSPALQPVNGSSAAITNALLHEKAMVMLKARFAPDSFLEGGGFELLVLKWTAYRENGDVERFWGLHPPRAASASASRR